MNKPTFTLALLALGAALCSASATAQQKPDFGKLEFEENCASCHGVKGKGDGPMVEFLTRKPPDLTQLRKNNQGVFPVSRLYEVVEGANVPGHGPRDMPIWGREYSARTADFYREARGLYEPEGLVRARILTVLEYINRLQTP